MWANHDVKQNYWNVHKYKDTDTLFWDGAVDLENFKIIVVRVINNYFNQPNYCKIEGPIRIDWKYLKHCSSIVLPSTIGVG